MSDHTPETKFSITNDPDKRSNWLLMSDTEIDRAIICVNALSGIEDVELFMKKIRGQDCFYYRDDYDCIAQKCTKDFICARCEALSLFPKENEDG